MDWKEIKDKCPKSFDLWEDYSWWFQYWDGKAHHIEGISVDRNDIRDLYDFFDEQGLVIFLKQGTLDGWLDFDIENRDKNFDKESRLTWDEVRTNRKGIEIVAFTKAFEILEDK